MIPATRHNQVLGESYRMQTTANYTKQGLPRWLAFTLKAGQALSERLSERLLTFGEDRAF